jgi:hypothetical protein
MKMNLIVLMLAIMIMSVSQPSFSKTVSEVKIIFADEEEGEGSPTDEEPDCE